jgi:hypothetical protein
MHSPDRVRRMRPLAQDNTRSHRAKQSARIRRQQRNFKRSVRRGDC